MATFTSPKTYAVGDVLTASDMNTYQRDNISDLDERLDLIESYTNATVATTETTTSTSYTDLATSGPAVTQTTGATAVVLLVARLSNSSAGATSWMSMAVSGATTLGADDSRALAYESSNANDVLQATAAIPVALTAGSNTFTAKYKVSAGTGSFSVRRLLLIPIGE